jgi:hypothetical protein
MRVIVKKKKYLRLSPKGRVVSPEGCHFFDELAAELSTSFIFSSSRLLFFVNNHSRRAQQPPGYPPKINIWQISQMVFPGQAQISVL